jgi:hypothetical protein
MAPAAEPHLTGRGSVLREPVTAHGGRVGVRDGTVLPGARIRVWLPAQPPSEENESPAPRTVRTLEWPKGRSRRLSRSPSNPSSHTACRMFVLPATRARAER